MLLNKYEVKKIKELNNNPLIKDQLEEVKELYPEIFEVVLKYVSYTEDYSTVLEDECLYNKEYDTAFMDVNFYSVIDYITELSIEDIKMAFGYYSNGSIFIDKLGRGVVIIGG